MVFVAAMVAAALFLLLGDEGPEVSAPIAIGTPPLRLDAGPKAVWVTSEKDGTLTRLDPETGEIVGKPAGSARASPVSPSAATGPG